MPSRIVQAQVLLAIPRLPSPLLGQSGRRQGITPASPDLSMTTGQVLCQDQVARSAGSGQFVVALNGGVINKCPRNRRPELVPVEHKLPTTADASILPGARG